MTQQTKTGTREWSKFSVNCQNGCGHRCRYCYARADALRRKQVKTANDWGTTYRKIRPKDVSKRRKNLNGRVMFPTTHDIEPEFLGECLTVLRKLLEAGNEVLIVSKPHLECVKAICTELKTFREQVTFRFSIGALDNSILEYWEPGAPSLRERCHSLEWVAYRDWKTSVSCEPYLDAPSRARRLYKYLEAVVTDTIWFGKLNHTRTRCPDASEGAILQIENWQTNDAVREVYESLEDEPKVRWKDSYQAVFARLGIAVPKPTETEG